MGLIIGALKIIIVLGTLITIHELGHFLVAKLFKVKVHKFAIGFGPVIFKKQTKETEYTLRLFPFGGFVQIEGEEEKSEDKNAFNNKPVWQRILIITAGAFVNIVFALIIYFTICVSDGVYVTSKLSYVTPNSNLYTAGLREDDTIVSVNGQKTPTASKVENAIIRSKDDNMLFEIERDGEKITLPILIETMKIGNIGVAFDNNGVINYIVPRGIGEASEILVGDKLVSINGMEDRTVDEIVQEIRKNAKNEISLIFERQDEENNINQVEIKVTPEEKITRKFDVKYTAVKPDFFGNIYYAIDGTGYYFTETIRGIAKIFVGDTENVEIAGPVGIAQMISGTDGVETFFYLMASISLSLGIFNLFPIPALDGGKNLILIIEAIRRKPISQKLEIYLQLGGFAFLILLALVITCFDVIKLF